MRQLARKLLADLHHLVLTFRHHESGQIAFAGRGGQGDKIRIQMGRLGIPLLLIKPGQIDDQGDIGRTLQQLFKNRGIKDDIAVEDDGAAL